MTITGTNFAAGATVTFGSAAATNVSVVNSTTITATTPAGSAGAVTVTVTVMWTKREPGQRVHLSCSADGDECCAEYGIDEWRDGGNDHGHELRLGSDGDVWWHCSNNVSVVNSTTMTATTPAGSAGMVTVTVTVNSQSGSLTNGYTYAVDTDGDECVAEQWTGSRRDGSDDHGDGLRGGSDGEVWRNGGDERDGGEQHDDHGDDAGASGGGGGGDGDGEWAEREPHQWIHVHASPPTVSECIAEHGTTAGGTGVTITGTGFLAGATVTLGGTAATNVMVVNSTTITATTAAHAAGAVSGDGPTRMRRAGRLTNGYTYVVNPAPTVSGVYHRTSGPTAGGRG